MADQVTSIKIVLLGDSGVGKTSIVAQYVSGSTPDSIKPTVGSAFFTKEITMSGRPLELLIWDTAGQEVYRGLAPMYYRSAKIAIIVFDITSAKSFESVSYWIKELTENVDGNLTIVVCGNKTDLEEARAVTPEIVQRKIEQVNAFYVETSATNGQGIDRLFQLAIQRQFSQKQENQNQDEEKVDLNNTQDSNTKKKGCC
ncbi:small GTP-binding protein, putative [Trichomonas vaginalis G3]|uniref:Small GTP-binding protein, putative n=2 Tax=Trichomonas vaginalis TaxID=5722 RepID=A0A8U0WPE4_TRIV3|nr:small Rab GTPase RabD3 [Trichomonas vaginalis G3]AAX97473.1 small Rab GTPase RabD3 [Trichomonas vaginalis]EAY12613.1 small GTP-binding protein, putative [Trichomonas vaginalis G3]KAI5546976.1 small Rab GTPase RabD3 [Trichomonas vaginalis G3]|eukprot:XP_001324836.1 small GTP-binding protein [Trichomonas vaginalis G3]